MKQTKLIILFLVSVFSLAVQAQSEENYFRNPVMNHDCPDPTLVKHRDGSYYLLSTGCPVYKSKDLVNWTYVKGAFQGVTAPSFVEGGGLWAPDVSYINDQYVIHYSMSTWGGEWTCGIGVAVSQRPYGPYTDLGKLFISSEIGVQNSIDPFYIEDDGKKYLFWGSFRGIYAIELSDDGLSIKEGAEKKQIAGTMIEGTYIHKHGDYYYLFGSSGSCCDGNNSSYQLVVARSKNLLGPYVDKNNKTAINNGFALVIKGDDNVAGPGHCSEIVTDDAGKDWIFYHGYRREDPDNGRVLHLDQVKWDSQDWPYIETEKPSEIAEKPVLGEVTPYTYSHVDYIEFKGESENFRHLFDTGYVPKGTTIVEVDCMSYDQDPEGNATNGNWRAIFSGRHVYTNGISLYVAPGGEQWGYFVGGFVNNGFAPHEYNKKYTVTASLRSLVLNDEEYDTDQNSFTRTYQRMTLFSGIHDYPYYGRIYSFRIYERTNLLHDYIPMLRNEDQVVVFYDRVTDTYMTPTTPSAFSYGSIVSGIDGVESDIDASSEAYNLQGQKVGSDYKGIVIENGKKMIRK